MRLRVIGLSAGYPAPHRRQQRNVTACHVLLLSPIERYI